MKEKWVIEIGPEGQVNEAGSDVPWFTCDTGVYKTNDDPPAIFQCGKAEVKGGKEEWTKIMFHEAFEKAPVVIAYTLAASGGGLIQVRQKPADADSFMAGLEHELMA